MSVKEMWIKTKEEQKFLLQDYAQSLFKRCQAIHGPPSPKDIDALKGLVDNVELWMQALQEQ